MFGKQPMTIIVGALMLGLVVPVMAATGDQVNAQALQERVQSLESQLASMQKAQGETWLNERRAQEVKGLIREVLADAETRASLLQDGVLAGHDGTNFFLRSADGNFLLNVSGQVQFRYVADFQDARGQVARAAAGDDQQGFQLRRAKIKFSGHAWDPNLGYVVQLATTRTTSNTFTEDVYITYRVNDELTVKGGVMKLPFLRQELISSRKQLAVERAGASEFFTLDRSEQIQVVYVDPSDLFILTGAISDGARGDVAGFTGFGADLSNFALTGRVDVKLAGAWDQAQDEVSNQNGDMALFVGSAVHWETGDGDANAAAGLFDADYLTWTVDTLFKQAGLSVLAAVTGAQVSGDIAGSGFSSDMYGAVVEGGYMVTENLQPFLRYEWVDSDAAGFKSIQTLTAGANYYLKGHNAKFTADVVWMFEGTTGVGAAANPFTASPFGSGLGTSGATGILNNDGLLVIRGQFQLLF
jgi:type II secretory pathway pseudopilin PulG